MILLTLLGGLLTTILGLWAIIAAHRSGTRTAALLVVAIPLLVAAPFGLHAYGTSLLGYAVTEPPATEFQLLHAYADDKRRVVVALLKLKGEEEPRLFEVHGQNEEDRKGFARANGKAQKGIPQGGVKRPGVRNEGAFEFYDLPPTGLPEKG